MTKRLIALAGALALAAAGAFAAVGIAGGEDDRPSARSLVNGYAPPGQVAHRVRTPSATARTGALAPASAKRAKRVRIAYFETNPFPIADGQALGQRLRCRGKRKVLGGYFGANGNDVTMTFSAPESAKAWFVGISNLQGAFNPPAPASEALLGIVCAKGV